MPTTTGSPLEWLLTVSCLSLVCCRELITGDDEVLGILETLCDHMTDEGVLVASMGYAPARFSAAIDAEIAKGFSDTLVKAGFESVRDYEEVCWAVL